VKDEVRRRRRTEKEGEKGRREKGERGEGEGGKVERGKEAEEEVRRKKEGGVMLLCFAAGTTKGVGPERWKDVACHWKRQMADGRTQARRAEAHTNLTVQRPTAQRLLCPSLVDEMQIILGSVAAIFWIRAHRYRLALVLGWLVLVLLLPTARVVRG